MAKVIIHLKDSQVHHVQANSMTKVEIRDYDVELEQYPWIGEDITIHKNTQGGSALQNQEYILWDIPSVRDV